MEPSPDPNANGDTSTTSNRRRSGRVVRAPSHLSPSGSKRKRSGDEAQDAGESSDSSSEDDNENSSDEGNRSSRPQRSRPVARNKTTVKRTKTNATSTALPMRPAAGKARPARRAPQDPSADAVGGIYGEVFGGRDPMDEIASRWLERFNADESEALTQIVNFILRCSGCNIEVTSDDINDPDNCASRLTDIQEEFQAQSITQYPLIAKGKGTATFKDNLSTFFTSLIKILASTEILFANTVLLENIQVWVSAMTSASFPPFRHTATIISLAIISGLSETGRSLTDNRAVSLRQGEGEKKKSKVNKKRVSDLQQSAKKSAEHGATLDNFIKDWFDTVFVHRYRDKEPRIRVECVTYLSQWIMTYPEQFFDGEHLRYLGWLLSDDNGPTRLETVKQLQTIYSDSSKTVGLRQFTERFRPRMVEMAARDAELNIRCSSSELIEILRESGLLEPNDIDVVGRLIYDREPRIRKSIAPFFVASVDETVAAKVDEAGGEEALEESLPAVHEDDSDKPRMEWLTFKSLAELLRSFEPESESIQDPAAANNMAELDSNGLESRISLAAEAFIDLLPMLKRWELLAGFLLFDHSQSTSNASTNEGLVQFQDQCRLDEKEEVTLLDVLNVSVKEALTEIATDNGSKKAKKSKAQLKEIQDEQEEAAQQLMNYIPKLMNKFGASPTAASAVLRLGRVLNLKIFEEFRHDSETFAAFLDDINRQFLTHQDAGVIAAARDALLRATAAEDLKEVTEGKLQDLWGNTIHTLVSSCKGDDMAERGSISEPFLTRIAQSVLRISNLAPISSCTEVLDAPKQLGTNENRRKKREQASSFVPIVLLTEAINRGTPVAQADPELDTLEDAISGHAAQSVLFYFMWHHHAIETAVKAGRALSHLNLSNRLELAQAASTNITRVISARRSADTLRVTLAGILLDLHVVFHESERAIKHARDKNESVGAEPWPILDSKAQTDLLKVFVALENDFARKSGRDLIEPAEDDEPEDLSDAEADNDEDDGDEEDDEAAQRKREKAERKQAATMFAERTLCELAGRIGLAISVGVIDRSADSGDRRQTAAGNGDGPIKTRLFRNRTKLGHDFREICNRLEQKGSAKKSKKIAQSGRAGTSTATKTNSKVKSQAVVIDDDSDEEIEELDNEQMDEEDVVQDENVADADNASQDPDMAESVLGD